MALANRENRPVVDKIKHAGSAYPIVAELIPDERKKEL
jgi:hypothetical protein